jgi:hypothetical protein
LNDSGRLELFEVLAHGRLRESRNFYEFSADAGLLGRDGVHDGEASGMTQCLKEFGERKVLRRK